MKKTAYTTPICNVISFACSDIIRTSISVFDDDEDEEMGVLTWKRS